MQQLGTGERARGKSFGPQSQTSGEEESRNFIGPFSTDTPTGTILPIDRRPSKNIFRMPGAARR